MLWGVCGDVGGWMLAFGLCVMRTPVRPTLRVLFGCLVLLTSKLGIGMRV